MSVGQDRVSVYPFIQYKGWTLLQYPCFRENTGGQLERIKSFKSRENDILLCTYPKTGTHWVHNILYMLVDQTTDYNSRPASIHFHLDFIENLDDLEAQTTRRILHSHLPYSCLPWKHKENKSKIIFVNRNPKDRHVSQFNFFRGLRGVPTNWTWGEYWNECINNDTLYGGWFNYTREMVTALQSNPDNIHLILFENLKLHPQKEIKRLAEFLEVPHNDTFINDIATRCCFHNLKEHMVDCSMYFHREGKSTLFRKGEIGDWKNWFTVAQNEQFEAMYSREMAGVDISFEYESPKI